MASAAPLPPELAGKAFTMDAARQAGLTRARTRASDLAAPYRGIRAPASAPRTILALCSAYAERMPAGQHFSHATAAILHGLPLPSWLERDPTLHVTAIAPATPPRMRGVVGHLLRGHQICGNQARAHHALGYDVVAQHEAGEQVAGQRFSGDEGECVRCTVTSIDGLGGGEPKAVAPSRTAPSRTALGGAVPSFLAPGATVLSAGNPRATALKASDSKAGDPRAGGLRVGALRVGALRVAAATDVWCQLATVLPLDDLVAVGDALVRRQRPFATIAELREAVERCAGRRGSRRLREALSLVRPGVDSPKETAIRLMLLRGGLPEPQVNATIVNRYGAFLALGDLVYPQFRVLVEYDGGYHFETEAQVHRDIDRLDDVMEEGWRVIRLNKTHLGRVAAVVAKVRTALTAAGWRPS